MTTWTKILKGKIDSKRWKNNNDTLIIQSLIIFLQTKNGALGTVQDEIIF